MMRQIPTLRHTILMPCPVGTLGTVTTPAGEVTYSRAIGFSIFHSSILTTIIDGRKAPLGSSHHATQNNQKRCSGRFIFKTSCYSLFNFWTKSAKPTPIRLIILPRCSQHPLGEPVFRRPGRQKMISGITLLCSPTNRFDKRCHLCRVHLLAARPHRQRLILSSIRVPPRSLTPARKQALTFLTHFHPGGLDVVYMRVECQPSHSVPLVPLL